MCHPSSLFSELLIGKSCGYVLGHLCNRSVWLFHTRRPQGEEGEFFVQLFMEPFEGLRLPNIETLLRRMFKEQHIKFGQVSCVCMCGVCVGGVCVVCVWGVCGVYVGCVWCVYGL